jgi:hypothetical protein
MKLALAFLCLTAILPAQVEDRSKEHKSFSGVNELLVDNVDGFIDVAAASGSTVEIDVAKTLSADSQDRLALARKEVRLDVVQEGGLLRLRVDSPLRFFGHQEYRFRYDFTIRAPKNIRLDLRAVNGAPISVQGTSGGFKLSNVNGPVEMRNVEGSGSVSTVNGAIEASFARNPTAASSFKSVNGKLDVSFRPDFSGDLIAKTLNGSVYTDFPVIGLPAAEQRHITRVRVGAGGPELNFETLNGDVLIRKGQ